MGLVHFSVSMDFVEEGTKKFQVLNVRATGGKPVEVSYSFLKRKKGSFQEQDSYFP
jgi:major membrane immunogen (membrane-anchored lipoprotein)